MATEYRRAMDRLQAAQKSNKGAPAYSRYVNRPLGRRFAALGFVVGLKPNQITALSAVCTFSAAVVIAVGPLSWWAGFLIGALLVVGYALDAADGQLARLRGGGSLSGEWLDHIVDAFKAIVLHMVVLAALATKSDIPRLWLVVPMVFAVADVVSFFAQLLNEQLRKGHYAKTGGSPAAKDSSTLRSLMAIPTDYGVFCVVFVLWGSPVLFMAAYSFLAAGTTGYLGLALVKWFHDMRRLDEEGVA